MFQVISGSKSQAGAGADAALAEAIAAGDPAAFRALIARCLPSVTGVARRMLGDEIEAEDVAQETLLRVWRNAHKWEAGRAKLETWVVRIAINLCYDRLRKRREETRESLPERADEGPSPADSLQSGQTARRVAEAVAGLPERQRLALELCHFQERTNIEAAALMDVSIEALESLLARGRRKLKAVLAAEAADLIGGYQTPEGYVS